MHPLPYPSTPYLTTEEAAAYLRLKERKLYELLAEGQIPATKVTGKWLFARSALDRWLEAGWSAPTAPPALIGGSHDPLLEWLVRRAACGLALLPEGSQAGLERVADSTAMVAAIHLHDPDPEVDANLAAVAHHPALADAVVIGFAGREAGLVLAPGNPLGITTVAEAAERGLRFGQRQPGAGAQRLLERVIGAQSVAVGGHYPTGGDLALGLRAGEVDCGIATRAIATLHGLSFLPLLWERFDLVMRRRSYFEPPMQGLIRALTMPSFARQAEAFGGYDLSAAGSVRFNR